MFIEKSGAAVKIAHYTTDIKTIILLNYRWNPQYRNRTQFLHWGTTITKGPFASLRGTKYTTGFERDINECLVFRECHFSLSLKDNSVTLNEQQFVGIVVGDRLQGKSIFFGKIFLSDSILNPATAVLGYQHVVSYTIIIIYYFITWILNSNISYIKLRQILQKPLTLTVNSN